MAGAAVSAFKTAGDHTLAGGVSWQHERAEDYSYVRSFKFSEGFIDPAESGSLLTDPQVKNDDMALFLQDVWSLSEPLTVTLGARFDEFESFGSYFNYRAAMVYSPEINHTWKLLYGTAIRTPSFREYLKVSDSMNFIQPPLKAERIKTMELGYLFRNNNISADVTLFNNRLEDFIREQPTPDGEDEYFVNSAGSKDLYGIESLLEYRPVDKLVMSLTAAYVDARNSCYSELPYIANWTGSGNVNYQFLSQHQIGFSLIYNSERRDLNAHQDDTAERFLLANLNVAGQLSQSLNYQFGVDNIFDKKVFDPAADYGNQYNTEKTRREIWLRLEWTPEFL